MKIENTSMEFVAFDAQDVIATSGELTVKLANFGDGTKNNGTFTYGDSSYTVGGEVDEFNDFISGLKTYLGYDKFGGTTKFYKSETEKLSLINLSNNEGELNGKKESDSAGYDGVYKWISESACFMKTPQQ